MNYKLNPSDLTFLYDRCKHCFVLKVKYGIDLPSIPIPSIFSVIASLQKSHYSGKRTEEFCPSLPPGVVRFGEKKIRSKRLQFPDCRNTCYINGRFDMVAELDNGGYAILDFKTGNPNDEKSGMYARQLQAYAVALENPEPGNLKLEPVTHLGLLYFTPDCCEQTQAFQQILKGPIQWIPIERNDERFLGFLREVIILLDGTIPKMEPDKCDWCEFRIKTTEALPSLQYAENSSPTNFSIPRCPVCNAEMRLKSGRHGEFWSCLNYPSCKGTRNYPSQ